MQIVQQLGGFSLGEADNLRRAMGKKKMAVMEENREYFVNGRIGPNGEIDVAGAVRNGVSPEIANRVYDLMIDFAKYAFNKSHSAAYSFVAMQTAYLKAYYPQEFMAALLSSVMGNATKVYLYIKEAQAMGIQVLSPNVNKSFKKFSVEDGRIRIGLNVIKTVGHNMVSAIVNERQANGDFTSFEDFIERMINNEEASLTKSYIEAFILSGALDGLGLKRSQMMNMYPEVFASYSDRGKSNVKGQVNMLDFMDEESVETEAPDIDEFPKMEFLKYEKEYIGVYITDHPYAEYGKMIENEINFTSLEIDENINNNKYVIMGGIVTSVKKILTKKNETMAFVTVEDNYGPIELVVFPRQYDKYKHLMIEDTPLFIKGNLQVSSQGEISVILDEAKEINNENFSKFDATNGIIGSDVNLYIQMDYQNKKLYEEVREILLESNGNNQVFVYFKDLEKMVTLKNISIDIEDEVMIEKLKHLLGENNIVIKGDK